MWASTDGGNTWTNLSPKYPANAFALAADPVTGALYVVLDGNLLMSTDGFNTTTAVGPVGVGVTSLAVTGTHLFAGAQASSDVFVVKLDPQGNPIYATYFGGAANDEAIAMAVDAAGSVYITDASS